jgi:uncharacterized OsmC-like protein
MDNLDLWPTHPMLVSLLSCQTITIQKCKTKVKIDVTQSEVYIMLTLNTNTVYSRI